MITRFTVDTGGIYEINEDSIRCIYKGDDRVNIGEAWKPFLDIQPPEVGGEVIIVWWVDEENDLTKATVMPTVTKVELIATDSRRN